MNIVIEGPDGSGKSTLVQHLLNHVPFTLQEGAGPEKYPGEIIERAQRYLEMEHTLFDRHPIISQPIYGKFRSGSTTIPQEMVEEFYLQGNLIIYMYGNAGPQVRKSYDSDAHWQMIQQFDERIRNAYEEWASIYATVRYSVKSGDLDAITNLCKEFCSET